MTELDKRMMDHIINRLLDRSPLVSMIYKDLKEGLQIKYGVYNPNPATLHINAIVLVSTSNENITFDELKEWYEHRERFRELFIELYELEKL